jgi:hypothetical protein
VLVVLVLQTDQILYFLLLHRLVVVKEVIGLILVHLEDQVVVVVLIQQHHLEVLELHHKAMLVEQALQMPTILLVVVAVLVL